MLGGSPLTMLSQGLVSHVDESVGSEDFLLFNDDERVGLDGI
nr:hypothetical protein Iba_chr07bCG6480 [Ipomoea batatas]